ncbi:MAG: DUF2085 domain-containing protein [Chloroflexi bacterium]|nr:DUF2085 domain-containing protein [Chloroflexota bacterium]MCL5273273.1 DUF2085 domain-containing protein [Chloroflexota bacterium]
MVKTEHAQKVEQPFPIGTLIAVLVAMNILVLFALWPLPWVQKFFLIASPFCPQRPAHSIFIGGRQMPIEARMFGMFGGALLALVYFAARRRLDAAAMPRGWRLVVCVALFGVMAFDGIQALLYDMGISHLYTPNLVLRLSTGLASGVGIAMVLVPLANLSLWQQPHTEDHLLKDWKDVVGLALVQALLYVVTLADWSPAFLPLSLFNSIAIVIIMTALMTLLLTLITGRAGSFTKMRAVVGYIAGGFIVVAVFITALAVARLAIFGPGPLG